MFSLRSLSLSFLFFAGPWLLADEPPGAKSASKAMEEAAARIEKHRKGDGVVKIVDAAGKPVAGVKVHVEQAKHAFLFGCNIFMWGRLGNPKDEDAYRRQFTELFNCATLPFYWPSYEPRQGKTDQTRLEAIAHWCHEHGIVTKGHPLAWNYFEPSWLPDDLDEVRNLQIARIKDCITRFQGLIDIWDVVNEATHFDRDELKRRAPKLTTMWAKTGQVEFVRQCFEQARSTNTKAVLRINDYRTDQGYVKLLTELTKDNKRPFDVIGIQSHMHGGTWSNARISEICERFARFGLPLQFSETTILAGKKGWQLAGPGKSWPSSPEDETWQAQEVERFYTMIFSQPAVIGLTWWDFSDRGAWMQAPAGLLRKDMTPRPAYQRLHKLIKENWWTKTNLTTNAEGEAPFRGFLGDYTVTVSTPDGKQMVYRMTLAKGTPNHVILKLQWGE